MDKKVIFFKQRSAKGAYSSDNGELASTTNISFNYSDNSGSAAGGDDTSSNTNDYILNAEEVNEQLDTLNNLASNLLPTVVFSLKPAVLAGWHNHPDNPPAMNVSAPKTKDSDGWKSVASTVLQRFHRDAARQHLFVEPFFALCALRLKDGNHILPSSPVLLMPNSVAPHVESSDDFMADTMTMTVPSALSTLCCRITLPNSSTGVGGLNEWTGEITALDIFVSDPLPLYHRDQPLLSVHRAAGSVLPQSWLPDLLTDSEFTASLICIDKFHLVSSIPVNKIGNQTDAIELSIEDLPTIYTPDFLQHHGIHCATGCRFSGRLTLCDLTLTLPTPPSPASLIPASPVTSPEGSNQSPLVSGIALEIESRKGNETLHSSCYRSAWPVYEISESDFPKWLFVPDPDATQLTLLTSECTYIVPLKRHPLLNGAYFWCGSLGYRDIADTDVRKTATTFNGGDDFLQRDSYRLTGAIWRSEKGSDLCFPDRLLMPLDTGRVRALCRAFRASGLVATTSPTAYLFSDTGIYLLKEMEDGSLRDAGLIAKYLLDSPQSILMGGRSLYFTTTDGIPMAITGTTVKALTTSSASSSSSESSSSSSASGSSGASLYVSGSSTKVLLTAADTTKPVEIKTRPIKLPTSLDTSNPTTLLNLSEVLLNTSDILNFGITIELLGTYSPKGLRMRLYGSCNLANWYPLGRSSDKRRLHCLLAPTTRYLRLSISGTLTGTLEALLLHLP